MASIQLQALVASAGRAPTYLLRDTFGADSTYGRLREQLVTPLLRERAGELVLVRRLESGAEIYRIAPAERERHGSGR